jgi:hypothetical protein
MFLSVKIHGCWVKTILFLTKPNIKPNSGKSSPWGVSDVPNDAKPEGFSVKASEDEVVVLYVEPPINAESEILRLFRRVNNMVK